jgi:sporulation protein YlmC with PRC-barrel domain
MHKLAIALLVSAALATPTLAQTKQETDTGSANKVAIPTNTFFKGKTANQYLASEQLIGAKVVNKDGEAIGTISDLIVSQGNQIEGVILAVGGFLGIGEKKIGVRMGALKISTAEGKTSITLATANKEVLSAVPSYQQALPGKK